MNDRQTHLEHFECGTHRVCDMSKHPGFRRKTDKPFAPGVLVNAKDLDRMNATDQNFTSLQSMAFWSFVGICLGLLVVVVSAAIGWLSVVLR